MDTKFIKTRFVEYGISETANKVANTDAKYPLKTIIFFLNATLVNKSEIMTNENKPSSSQNKPKTSPPLA